MEEKVGELWHKLITRAADAQHPKAAVYLHDLRKTLGIFFRALGGDSGLQLEIADATSNLSRRNLLQRIAGSNTKIQLAWRDENALKLPASIAWFEDPALNTDLYYWLACLAAVPDDAVDGPQTIHWFARNQAMVLNALEHFPGIRPRYQRLVNAHLLQRPDTGKLKGEDAEAELGIQQALKSPGSIQHIPYTRYPPQPVPLWLHPDPPLTGGSQREAEDSDSASAGDSREIEEMAKRQAERVEEPESERGLITVRMENIFTMGEFVNVDRGTEDEDDMDRAENVARELDKLSVSKNARASKNKLKFDLDLPSAESDDTVLSDGILLPEWDWKKQQLLPNRCRIVQMIADDAEPCPLPAHLTRTAKRLRDQFQAITPARTWHNRQMDGQDIDIDAYLRFIADRTAGHKVAAENLYREMRSGARDLACLLLADLSLSTDAHINDNYRVIDVIRDSLYLFAESLNATGDRFSMLGFSSRRRNPIRVHQLKNFDETYNATIRGRINAIKPGYYTRLGAGIRHASELLKNQGSSNQLLLILTDGKPNDLDQYEGRYGIEDTRQAVIEARQMGLQPFCVTIDSKGNDYLPHIFGNGAYVVVRNPEQLPRELPRLYALLTRD
ncbi:MAG TPA: VWA domain-containing protein [Gammaproteobacteria bacterium]|nr:VWA domain-containing protein [Gammaproteobacteria bacterium]